jgi:hypothetical protein
MSSNTLEGLGRAVLEAIEGRRVDAGALEEEFDASREELDEQLSQLLENALVREAGDGEYELTENGERLLESTPVGTRNDRIDTPDDVERAIEGFDLRPDEERAVRSAFSFLRYWGDATAAEIVDATYGEEPAAYDAAERWWDDCVAERLAALPDVDPPAGGTDGSNASLESRWRYAGETGVDQPDSDGRGVRGRGDGAPFGSVRHALEELGLTDAERTAARAAFAALSARGGATTAALADALFDEHPAGYDSLEAWVDWLDGTFEELPDVDRRGGGSWIHDPAPE